jgi:hypothetical protein
MARPVKHDAATWRRVLDRQEVRPTIDVTSSRPVTPGWTGGVAILGLRRSKGITLSDGQLGENARSPADLRDTSMRNLVPPGGA